MTDIFDIFGVAADGETPINRYAAIGYPRNPFRDDPASQACGLGPFYRDHIRQELTAIQQWVADVHTARDRQPMALIGTVGVGKTRILRYLWQMLAGLPEDARVVAELLWLPDSGYARGSLGGMLVGALERMSIPGQTDPPEGVLSLVWAIVTAERDVSIRGSVGRALSTARRAQAAQRTELARHISAWIQRATLTPREADAVGLHRRVDWEGELIRVVTDLMRAASECGAVKTFYLFVDQLEDLFRPTFSQLRRSRILTDIRGLVDDIDAGAPVGLILSWTPDFGQGQDEVDRRFQNDYIALYSRLRRHRVNIPLLSYDDAAPFALVWLATVEREAGYDTACAGHPTLHELVYQAWSSLDRARLLYSGNKTTPRHLLAALADEVDRAAGLKSR